jgi:superfamily II DNA/RNA helicase
MPTFADLGVRPETVDALESRGITEPFAIQNLAIPLALDGHDVIGQARTGTGKTLAFGAPILQTIAGPDDVGPGDASGGDAAASAEARAKAADGVPQALVVVPTRELCVQVARDLEAAGSTRHVRVEAIYGGRSYEPQVAALRRGVDIVVGTPGRLLDLSRQKALDVSRVDVLVLDEADEMLDLGFLPDVERIIALTPGSRQTMLFSATMPAQIVSLARRYLRQPTNVRAESPDENRTVPTTRQHVYRAHALDKAEMLARMLQAEGRGLTLVFCRTKRTAAKVADDLSRRGFAAAAVHGDLGQGAREQAMRAFRSGKVDVLVATDVAARGIDVTGVTHVVNYQCPEDEKVYLHRIGRTGRAGGDGVAVTFVDWDELHRWQLINQALSLPFTDPPETYSTSDHLYDDLDIPSTAGSKLPRSARTRAGLDAEEIEDLGETGRGRSERRPSSGRGHGETRPSDGPRRRRGSRRRTRSGQPVGDAAPAKSGGATGSKADQGVQASANGDGGAAEPAESSAQYGSSQNGQRRRRRRGRRGGRSRAKQPAES